ncbi:4-hydroxy-tetrahydrodipicolinate synthase [Seramator thermalis]|jgi:4-hydroxy-tetrahydrodipicolinate synthase|uniref:4-hydroxy-tetrahydrodipicolinate synthase n=1 Tax=Seramator thermalis TaxID=2496270 RepID=UPI00101CDEA9|nr:4-hydroxy-tetrahydrodipicolinate synthase [Seramator thermalis]MDN5296075.1 4-hydroxy-tetrahydrodipicolinate synthase [Bacteroidota bacterium]HOT63837.1 4-hydroxy-tetrahydrodipicolinate synthase [Dysgonamonadaceae bacterium]HPD42727.1 4-hydroxy-tetrahydrodipicolinate synthase [Dysgonamonadaceae bacterium]
MSAIHLEGMGVALVTPFRKDKAVDFEALDRLLDFHLENGTDYIVALGTTAETPTLSESEKSEIVSAVVRKIGGRMPIVMGVGGNNTAGVVQQLKTLNFDGVDAILSVTPYYNKPTQEGLFQHYRAISEASPRPVILYNVPGRTGVNLTAETTLRIARECKNVVAIKEASGNLDQIRAIITGAPEGFKVISGDDATTIDIVESGGIGVISVFGNAYPKQMSDLVHDALKGKIDEARKRMKTHFDELFRLMFVDGNPAGVKCVLHEMGLIENELRLPLVPVTENTRKLIVEEMKKFA